MSFYSNLGESVNRFQEAEIETAQNRQWWEWMHEEDRRNPGITIKQYLKVRKRP